MSNTNLLAETLEVLDRNRKTPQDVRFIIIHQSEGGPNSFSWDAFAGVAKDINYDNGFGGNEINLSLRVVGDDWWLERGEYDGSEWWEFKTMPIKGEKFNPNQHDILAR